LILKSNNMELTIYSDGGSRGNPGQAAIGAVIFDQEGNKIKEISEHIGTATNNQAEYIAVIKALEEASNMKAEKVKVFMDSELVVKQARREYKIKNPELSSLFVKLWNIVSKFKECSFNHIPREKNSEADALVNKALDELEA